LWYSRGIIVLNCKENYQRSWKFKKRSFLEGHIFVD
jgi:hypothetical protein